VNQEKKGRTCFVCHNSHAANRDHLIRETFPFGPKNWPLPIGWERTENGGKCAAGCHRSYVYDRVQPAVYPTTPNREADWRGRDLVPGSRAEPVGRERSADKSKTAKSPGDHR